MGLITEDTEKTGLDRPHAGNERSEGTKVHE